MSTHKPLPPESQPHINIDESYFDGFEERLDALPDKPRRWCKCGHIDGTHFFGVKRDPSGDLQTTCRCHARDCKCTDFRPRRRKNRIKFFFTGRA